jgi:hypothetical protein
MITFAEKAVNAATAWFLDVVHSPNKCVIRDAGHLSLHLHRTRRVDGMVGRATTGRPS